MNKADIVRKTQVHKLFKPFTSGIGHALMFHRVYNDDQFLITKGLQITQDYIENVIKYFIAQKIDIVSLDEFHHRLTSKSKSKRFVTFTFDDGYLDNLTHALPVFEKYNAPFSVFVTTGYPDNKAIMWWYLFEELILSTDKVEFDYNNEHHCYVTQTTEEKRVAFTKLKIFILASTSLDNYLLKVKSIFSHTDIDMYHLNEKLSLSWKQVKQMSDHELVTIGAHTVNHLSLTALSDKEVYDEIYNSIKILEEKIEKKVLYFAYPFGTEFEAGQREFEIAQKCGLTMAFTTQKNNIFKRQAKELFSIPRLGINSTMNLSHIELFINGMTPVMSRFVKI